MSDLKSFISLQARLYEFLEQQNETTLRALATGAARLAVVDPDGTQALVSTAPQASRPKSPGLALASSGDPQQVANHLLTLTSEQERWIYLNGTELAVRGLRMVAKRVGATGYSRLNRMELMELLVGFRLTQTTKLPAAEPAAPSPSPSILVGTDSDAKQTPTSPRPQPTSVTSPTGPAQPNADAVAIAARLRQTETEEEGAAYLHGLHLDHESLLAVATALQLTRVDRLRQSELEKRVLKQAIGARRKFAGLRKW